MKSRVNEFGVCPICGQSDKLSLLAPDAFYRILHKHPMHGSVVSIECFRCGLTLSEYTSSWSKLKTNNYHIVVGELKKKWAKL